jgi:hypothetical protein
MPIGIAPGQARAAVSLARDAQVGGLFIGSDDTKSLTDGAVKQARTAAPIPLFVSIDEEGGLRVAGVLPVLEHFPGQRHAVGDPHTGAAVTPSLSSLLRDDLVPYRTLPAVGATAVMMGHLEVPGLTGTVPAEHPGISPTAHVLSGDPSSGRDGAPPTRRRILVGHNQHSAEEHGQQRGQQDVDAMRLHGKHLLSVALRNLDSGVRH